MNQSGSSTGLLRRKWQTFWYVARDAGVTGVIRVGTGKIINSIPAIKKCQNQWRRNDHWILGAWVEWTGNKVTIDHCQFSVNHPSIPTLLKSRFLMGRYESSEHKALPFLDTKLPLVEMGGGIGVISCLANHRLENQEIHIVVEANPEIIPLLDENRKRNGCQFKIINAAVGYSSPDLEMKLHHSMLDSNLFSQGFRTVRVPSTNLEMILDKFSFSVCSLICDIEGAEYDLINNEIECLKKRVILLILETHPSIIQPVLIQKMLEKLENAGFERIQTIDRKNFVYRNITLSSPG
jgi:FkbM family methyltransferase